MKTVIFDLDGTLADTSGDLIAAANASFASGGMPPLLDPERDALTAFHGGRAMLRLGLSRQDAVWSEDDVDALYAPFLDIYRENIDVFTTVYPGVVGALDTLAARGYGLGICTNKPEGLAETLMKRLGLRDRFGALLGADTLPQRKPDARHLLATVEALGGNPRETLLVGDTANDRDAARNAGVASVLVTFGPEGRSVDRMKPEALLDHYDALPGLVAELIG